MVKSFREQPKTPITVHLRRFRELDLDVCKNTFAKYMKQLDLKSYSPRFKAGMNEKQKAKRLQWCKERVNWTDSDWRKVIWSDESRFKLVGHDGRQRVIRKAGEDLTTDTYLAKVLSCSGAAFGMEVLVLWCAYQKK